MAKKNKELKLWNVRDQINFKGTMYIAAYNRSQASTLILQSMKPGININHESFYRRKTAMNRELREYASEGAWGDNMKNITPELGVWRQEKYGDKPIRTWPVQSNLEVWDIEGSSNIAQMSYDKEKQTLYVLFHNTNEYKYEGVPYNEVKEVVTAESVGKAFGENIRQIYKGEKLK